MSLYLRSRVQRARALSPAFPVRLYLLVLALTASCAMLLGLCLPADVAADSDSQSARQTSLLPVIITGPTFDPERMCAPSYEELKILEYMRDDPEQRREELHCNAVLSRVARAHAEDMAIRGYFDHVNLDGEGPNYLVMKAGFDLPYWYPDSSRANNLESIGAHFATPAEVWDAWSNSPGHRLHVLGLDPFFADHTEIGVGYHYEPNSEYGAYWVLITAPPEEK